MLYPLSQLNLDPTTEVVYLITSEDLQAEAEKLLGRKLTEEELYRAAKEAEYGLSEGSDIVFETAIRDAVREQEKDAAGGD